MRTSHSDSDCKKEACQPVWDGMTPQLYSEKEKVITNNNALDRMGDLRGSNSLLLWCCQPDFNVWYNGIYSQKM
jgi:hypothetical protein